MTTPMIPTSSKGNSKKPTPEQAKKVRENAEKANHISDLIIAYPTQGTPEMDSDRIRVYLKALAGIPSEFVQKAVDGFLDGTAGLDHNYEFCPPAPILAIYARSLIPKPVVNIPIRPAVPALPDPLTDEFRRKISELLADLAQSMKVSAGKAPKKLTPEEKRRENAIKRVSNQLLRYRPVLQELLIENGIDQVAIQYEIDRAGSGLKAMGDWILERKTVIGDG